MNCSKKGDHVEKIYAPGEQWLQVSLYGHYRADELVNKALATKDLPVSFREECRQVFEGKSGHWRLKQADVFTAALVLQYVYLNDGNIPEQMLNLTIESPVEIGLVFQFTKADRKHKVHTYRYECQLLSSSRGNTHTANIELYVDDETEARMECCKRSRQPIINQS